MAWKLKNAKPKDAQEPRDDIGQATYKRHVALSEQGSVAVAPEDDAPIMMRPDLDERDTMSGVSELVDDDVHDFNSLMDGFQTRNGGGKDDVETLEDHDAGDFVVSGPLEISDGAIEDDSEELFARRPDAAAEPEAIDLGPYAPFELYDNSSVSAGGEPTLIAKTDPPAGTTRNLADVTQQMGLPSAETTQAMHISDVHPEAYLEATQQMGLSDNIEAARTMDLTGAHFSPFLEDEAPATPDQAGPAAVSDATIAMDMPGAADLEAARTMDLTGAHFSPFLEEEAPKAPDLAAPVLDHASDATIAMDMPGAAPALEPTEEMQSPAAAHAAVDELDAFAPYRPAPESSPEITDAVTVPITPSRLIVRLGNFSATYELSKTELLIGRPDPDNSINPDLVVEWDDAISRRHAQILRKADGDYVEDLGSTNGTSLNGVLMEPHQPALLRDGDIVAIGDHTQITYYR